MQVLRVLISVLGVATILALIPFALIAQGKHPSYKELMEKPKPDAKAWFTAELTDTDNKVFTPEKFQGKLVLVSFFFTHCPDICPPQTAGLHKTWNKLSLDLQKEVVFLTISVDYQNDNPEKLRAYKKQFEIKNSTWVFAHASKESLAIIAKYFGSLADETKPLEHRNSVYLVDPKGKLLLAYRTTPTIDSDRLAGDLKGAAKAYIKN